LKQSENVETVCHSLADTVNSSNMQSLEVSEVVIPHEDEHSTVEIFESVEPTIDAEEWTLNIPI